MNLTDILYKLKNSKALSIGLVILIIGLVVWIMINSLSTPTTDLPDIAQVNLADEFKGSEALQGLTNQMSVLLNPELEKTLPNRTDLPVYEYTPKNFFTDENIDKLVKTLNLNITNRVNSPVQGDLIYASGNGYSLSIEKDRGIFTYGKNQFEPNTESFENKNPKDYVNRGYDSIRSLGLDPARYTSTRYGFKRMEAIRQYNVNVPGAANGIEIIYEARLNDLAIIDKDRSTSPNHISINYSADFSINTLYVETIGSVGSEITDTPLKNRETLLKELREKKFQIIQAEFMSNAPITTLAVDQVELGYFAFDNRLVPVFIITGNASSGPAVGGRVTLLMEAVPR